MHSGEIPVAGSGHAEIKVLNAARLRGQTVRAIATTRPVRERCRQAIQETGARIVGQGPAREQTQ